MLPSANVPQNTGNRRSTNDIDLYKVLLVGSSVDKTSSLFTVHANYLK